MDQRHHLWTWWHITDIQEIRVASRWWGPSKRSCPLALFQSQPSILAGGCRITCGLLSNHQSFLPSQTKAASLWFNRATDTKSSWYYLYRTLCSNCVINPKDVPPSGNSKARDKELASEHHESPCDRAAQGKGQSLAHLYKNKNGWYLLCGSLNFSCPGI